MVMQHMQDPDFLYFEIMKERSKLQRELVKFRRQFPNSPVDPKVQELIDFAFDEAQVLAFSERSGINETPQEQYDFLHQVLLRKTGVLIKKQRKLALQMSHQYLSRISEIQDRYKNGQIPHYKTWLRIQQDVYELKQLIKYSDFGVDVGSLRKLHRSLQRGVLRMSEPVQHRRKRLRRNNAA